MPDSVSPRALAHRHDRLRALLLLGLIVIVLVALALLAYQRPHATGQRVGVGDVLTMAKDKRVVTAVLRDEDALVVGEVRAGRGMVPQGGTFSAELPANGELTASLTALLAATGASVRVDHQGGKDNARVVLTSLLPVLALTDLVALVLLSSPYSERMAPNQPRRGRHSLPAAPVEAQPADVDQAPPSTVTKDLAAAPVEVQPDSASARAATARKAARKAAARPRAAAPRDLAAAPAEVQPKTARPRKAAPRTASASTAAARATTAGPTPRKAPSKAQPAQDVLPVKASRKARPQRP